MRPVVIVDYGMGNVRSVARALKHVAPQAEVLISHQADDIAKADRLVLPGQGSMPDCMDALKRSQLLLPLLRALQEKPALGICVGMQMLFQTSAEGNSEGLGIFPGGCLKFSPAVGCTPLKVPQMGWNQIDYTDTNTSSTSIKHPVFAHISPGSYFYFVHSYYLPLSETSASLTVTTSNYGVTFVSAIAKHNIVATQFHPEKSGTMGLKLYHNFYSWQL